MRSAGELLVVNFGTSYNDNRRLTIGAMRRLWRRPFPWYSVKKLRSQIIIDHVKDRDGEVIDNVGEEPWTVPSPAGSRIGDSAHPSDERLSTATW